VDTRLWRRVAIGVAGGAAGYLAARAVRRTVAGGGAVPAAEDTGAGSYGRAATIYRPLAEVYRFWRDLPNLAQAFGHVVRVDEVDDRRSRWIVEGPGRSEVEFFVEILSEEPQRRIDWLADGAPVPHEGWVEFMRAPGRRGTEVRLHVTYLPDVLSRTDLIPMTGDRAERLVYEALRRVKQTMEAGEVLTADGQSSGRDAIPERLTGAAAGPAATGDRA
jgi:uncharacterized membrane protein